MALMAFVPSAVNREVHFTSNTTHIHISCYHPWYISAHNFIEMPTCTGTQSVIMVLISSNGHIFSMVCAHFLFHEFVFSSGYRVKSLYAIKQLTFSFYLCFLNCFQVNAKLNSIIAYFSTPYYSFYLPFFNQQLLCHLFWYSLKTSTPTHHLLEHQTYRCGG